MDRFSTSAVDYIHTPTISQCKVGLRNSERFDYRLVPNSPAIDAATLDLTTDEGKPLVPMRQYLHPRRSEPRNSVGARDIGAYEFLAEPTASD